MNTPNASKLLLVADRRATTAGSTTAVAVRRYRLARLRVGGPTDDTVAGLEQTARTPH